MIRRSGWCTCGRVYAVGSQATVTQMLHLHMERVWGIWDDQAGCRDNRFLPPEEYDPNPLAHNRILGEDVETRG